jgi:DNA polymerase-3 subunit gamma/tau
VQRLIDLLREVVDEVKEGSDPRLPLELALVKVCRPQGELSLEALQQRLERLESGAPAPPPPPATAAAAPPAAPAPAAVAEADPPAAAPEPRNPPPASGDGLMARWEDAVLPEIGRRSPPLRALLDSARPTGVDDGVVTLAFSLAFAKAGASSSENEELIAEVLGQALGGPVRLRIVDEEAPAVQEPAGEEPVLAVEPQEAVSEDDLFDQFKEAFDAHEVKESR